MDERTKQQINSGIQFRELIIQMFANNALLEIEGDGLTLKRTALYGPRCTKDEFFELYPHLMKNNPSYEGIIRTLSYLRARIEEERSGTTIRGIANRDEQVKTCLELAYEIVTEKQPEIESATASFPQISLLEDRPADKYDEYWTHKTYKDNVTLYGDLVRKMFFTLWDEPQRDHFDHVFGLLRDNVRLFLSFTRLNCNLANERFRTILEIIYKQRKSEMDNAWDGTNLAVKITYENLQRFNMFNTFYDEARITSNMDILNEIDKNLERTLTLVQFVNRDTFMNEQKRFNWCYYEFGKFVKVMRAAGYSNALISAACIFVVTDETILPSRNNPRAAIEDDLPSRFGGWYRMIRQKRDHVWIEGIRDPIDLETKVASLAKSVRNSHMTYIRNIPIKVR